MIRRIQIIDLQKKYHSKVIFEKINLTFTEGKCYMLIGENGSGKSTIIKMILGLVSPTFGKIINDFKSIGYVPEKINLPLQVKVIDFLLMISNVNSNEIINNIDNELNEWKILYAKNYRLKELSKGMLQKVLIIQSLLNKPSIYIFDEVLNGLDKEMQTKLLNKIKELKKDGCLIIITSHYAKYYEEVVDCYISMPLGDEISDKTL